MITVVTGACDDESDFDENFDFARSYCLRRKLDIRETFFCDDGFSYKELVVNRTVFFCICEHEDLSNVTGRIS